MEREGEKSRPRYIAEVGNYRYVALWEMHLRYK